METKSELFTKWYVDPISTLQSIPNGDGGFIALATGCFLYERCAIAALMKNNINVNTESFLKQLSFDFNTDPKIAKAFWSVVRDGLLHQGMPKQRNHGKKDLPGYILHHSNAKPFDLTDCGGEQALKIQPWLFVWRVIELCEDNIEIVIENDNFPFPNVL